MPSKRPVAFGTGIVNVSGTDYVILGFFGDRFAVARAIKKDGVWYREATPSDPLDAHRVCSAIRNNEFETVEWSDRMRELGDTMPHTKSSAIATPFTGDGYDHKARSNDDEHERLA